MSNLVKLCLVGVILALAAVFIFKLQLSSFLFFAFLLACPLMHSMMMHGDKSGKSGHNHR